MFHCVLHIYQIEDVLTISLTCAGNCVYFVLPYLPNAKYEGSCHQNHPDHPHKSLRGKHDLRQPMQHALENKVSPGLLAQGHCYDCIKKRLHICIQWL